MRKVQTRAPVPQFIYDDKHGSPQIVSDEDVKNMVLTKELYDAAFDELTSN